MNILAISDTHGKLTKEDLLSFSDYDLCVVLGDLNDSDFLLINKYIKGQVPVIGVLGNNNKWGDLHKHCIKNVHGKIFKFKDSTITGFQGGEAYERTRMFKKVEFPAYNQRDSKKVFETIPKADILISHDGPTSFYKHNHDYRHGLKGITQYLETHKPKLNIHGHHHKNDFRVIKGTKINCVYGCEIISI